MRSRLTRSGRTSIRKTTFKGRASGDDECFCFDRRSVKQAKHDAGLSTRTRVLRADKALIYPTDFMPDWDERRPGTWTVTVEFFHGRQGFAHERRFAMTLKVHILEGTQSNGSRVYACGRFARAGSGQPCVGRAKLRERGTDVTCVACQKRYAFILTEYAAEADLRSGRPADGRMKQESALFTRPAQGEKP